MKPLGGRAPTLPEAPDPTAGTSEQDATEAYTVDEVLEKHVGSGKWQAFMMCFCGAAWAADACEVMLLALLGPAAACEWGLGPAAESTLSSVVFAGMLCGAPAWGAIADRWGRLLTFRASATVTIVAGVLSAVSTSFTMLLALRCLVGVGVAGMPSVYTLLLEWLTPSTRGRWLAVFQGWWTVGTVLEALLAWWLLNSHGWRVLLAVSVLPMAAILLLSPLVSESPRYLLATHRPGQARQVLARAAAVNGRRLPPDILLRLPADDQLDSAAAAAKGTSSGVACCSSAPVPTSKAKANIHGYHPASGSFPITIRGSAASLGASPNGSNGGSRLDARSSSRAKSAAAVAGISGCGGSSGGSSGSSYRSKLLSSGSTDIEMVSGGSHSGGGVPPRPARTAHDAVGHHPHDFDSDLERDGLHDPYMHGHSAADDDDAAQPHDAAYFAMLHRHSSHNGGGRGSTDNLQRAYLMEHEWQPLISQGLDTSANGSDGALHTLYGTTVAAAGKGSGSGGGGGSTRGGQLGVLRVTWGVVSGLVLQLRPLMRPPLRRTVLQLMAVWFVAALSYYGMVLLAAQGNGVWDRLNGPQQQQQGSGSGDGSGSGEGGAGGGGGEDAAGQECVAHQIRMPASTYVNTIVAASAELPSLLAVIAVVDVLGHIATTSAGLAATGVCLLPLALAALPRQSWPSSSWQSAVPGGHTTITLVLFFSRFFSSAAFTALYIVTPELFPTAVRALALGVCNCVSRLGGLLAPFLTVGLPQQGHAGAGAALMALACGLAATLMMAVRHSDRHGGGQRSGGRETAGNGVLPSSAAGTSGHCGGVEDGDYDEERAGLLQARRT